MGRRLYRETSCSCAAAATAAGFGQSGVAQVVSAFEKKEKPAVFGCTFRSALLASHSYGLPSDCGGRAFVSYRLLFRDPMAASGFQAEKSLNDTMRTTR